MRPFSGLYGGSYGFPYRFTTGPSGRVRELCGFFVCRSAPRCRPNSAVSFRVLIFISDACKEIWRPQGEAGDCLCSGGDKAAHSIFYQKSHEGSRSLRESFCSMPPTFADDCYPAFLSGGTFRCESMACQRSQSRCRFSQNSGPVLSASPSANAESALT